MAHDGYVTIPLDPVRPGWGGLLHITYDPEIGFTSYVRVHEILVGAYRWPKGVSMEDMVAYGYRASRFE